MFGKKELSNVGLRRLWEGHKELNLRLSQKEKLEALRASEQQVRDYYRDKFVRRERFLDTLAREAEEANEIDKEKALKEICKKEKRDREFRRLRYILRPRSAGVAPEVEVPSGMDSVDQM